jgi:predicted nucleotidyltransferase
MLENHISDIYNQNLVKLNDYKTCASILATIQNMLRKDKNILKNYGLAKVENFGSSANSLWSMDSDIDIAVQFEPTEESQGQGRQFET